MYIVYIELESYNRADRNKANGKAFGLKLLTIGSQLNKLPTVSVLTIKRLNKFYFNSESRSSFVSKI